MSCKVPLAVRGNFGVNFVGRNLEQRVIALHFFAGCFSHLVIVPSKIDSPIWGMMTSVGIVPSAGISN